MQGNPPHLVLEGLSVGYGAAPVLEDIRLAIGKGQFVALLGASGCGKTTLLRAIAGFETPVAGRISVAGRDVTGEPPDRRGMAMVFQSYALWPHRTVAQHLAYGLRLRRVPPARIAARVAELERMLGLEGLGARRPGALSGGQRQRVALGRALAIDPDILLLDEPLSNLDARIRLQLRGEIRELQRRLGITAIHVTHDREEAMVMADRIVILDRGRVMQDGTPQALYDRPNSSFVAAFMGAENSVALEAVATPAGTVIAAGPHNDALPAGLPPGPVEARFRAAGPVLQPPGVPAAPGTLVLHGTVRGTAYPGGGWLHEVALGATVVQVMAGHAFAPGTAVDLHVPRDALFLFGPPAGSVPSAPGPRGRRAGSLLPA